MGLAATVGPFFIHNSMTEEQIASAIRNNVGNGLKEVYNHAYSIEQLEDEIGNTRNQIILENSQTGVLNPEYFTQKIDNLELSLVRFPYEGYSNSPERVLHTKIPAVVMTSDNSGITFLGTPDMSTSFKIYYDTSFANHSYSRVIKNRPFVFVDLSADDNGELDTYYFKLGDYGIREVSIRAIFSNPHDLLVNSLFASTQEYPAPPSVQQMIIDRLTAKYVEYYKKLNLNYQPNTQTDLK